MKIDFVSDITCPWCAIGLASLERAIARVDRPVEVQIQPFELNPGMPAEGEDIERYVALKYGSTPEQFAERQALIRARGAEVGFEVGPRTRIWNTFDAHRLLHWAGLGRRQLPLKRALLAAYHTRGENPSSEDVLLHASAEAGLDVDRACEVLTSGGYAAEVRDRIGHWQALGIHSVPSVIIDERFLIQGGQPVAVFEQALREIAAQPVAV